MLISKEITRTIGGETKVVKVEDLPRSCKDKVLVKCDYCGETYEQAYYDYLQSLKAHNGKNCCDYCTVEEKIQKCYQNYKENEKKLIYVNLELK